MFGHPVVGTGIIYLEVAPSCSLFSASSPGPRPDANVDPPSALSFTLKTLPGRGREVPLCFTGTELEPRVAGDLAEVPERPSASLERAWRDMLGPEALSQQEPRVGEEGRRNLPGPAEPSSQD